MVAACSNHKYPNGLRALPGVWRTQAFPRSPSPSTPLSPPPCHSHAWRLHSHRCPGCCASADRQCPCSPGSEPPVASHYLSTSPDQPSAHRLHWGWRGLPVWWSRCPQTSLRCGAGEVSTPCRLRTPFRLLPPPPAVDCLPSVPLAAWASVSLVCLKADAAEHPSLYLRQAEVLSSMCDL